MYQRGHYRSPLLVHASLSFPHVCLTLVTCVSCTQLHIPSAAPINLTRFGKSMEPGDQVSLSCELDRSLNHIFELELRQKNLTIRRENGTYGIRYRTGAAWELLDPGVTRVVENINISAASAENVISLTMTVQPTDHGLAIICTVLDVSDYCCFHSCFDDDGGEW